MSHPLMTSYLNKNPMLTVGPRVPPVALKRPEVYRIGISNTVALVMTLAQLLYTYTQGWRCVIRKTS